MSSPSPFVWTPDFRVSRISHVLFRRVLRLKAAVAAAEIHLSARMQYHLRVNGFFVGCGPARSYPEFLEYDSHDLVPFLQAGENVVAVEVVHLGVPTYHFLAMPPGFVAFGEVEEADGVRHDLATGGEWRCRQSAAHDPEAPSFSFAIGPIQIEDARRSEPGWALPGFDDAAWAVPVPVPGPGGEALRPRLIPHLTRDEVVPERLVRAFAHADDEAVYSFRVTQAWDPALPVWPNETSFAFTRIYSPCDQEVVAGTWWGEHYLNGKLLRKMPSGDGRALREDAPMSLCQGWNTLFISYRMTYGVWEFLLGLPQGRGLVVAAGAESGGRPTFRVAGPLRNEDAHRILAAEPWHDPSGQPELQPLWREVAADGPPASVVRGLAWRRAGKAVDVGRGMAGEIGVPAGEGQSLLYDFGTVVLGRIFVEYTAPAGTVVDVGYAEEACDDRPHYGKNFLVHAAERQVAPGGRGRLETFFPRGFRHLEVAVHGHDGPVQIHRVGIVSQVYPLVRRGAFSCSDGFLNTLWEYGWRTMQLCSEDVITDCPWRERTLYGGDLLAEMATMAVASGDLRLVRRCVEVFLQSQDAATGWLQSMAPMRRDRVPLYEYPVLVLIACEWYCRLANDAEFAERARPVLARLLESALASREPSGLFPAVHPVFIEHGYGAKEGCVCAFNALMAGAFRAWGRLLAMLGRGDEADAAATLAEDIAACVNRDFWSPAQAAYMDALVDGNFTGGSGVAAGAWAMAFAGVPEGRVEPVNAYFRAAMRRFDPENEAATVSVYGAFYLLGALYRHGLAGDAEAWMRTLYRDMVERPTGTIWEHANPTKSLVHAWSTAPNYYLSTRALGVRLGFPETETARLLIAPESETLTWAEGVVPHPLGEVFVKWRIDGDRLVLQYRCPDGVEPIIAPVGRLARLRLEAERLD